MDEVIQDFRSVWLSYKNKFPNYFLIKNGVKYFCSIIKEAYSNKNNFISEIPCVRYEDFQSDFECEMRKLMEAIDISFEDEILSYNNTTKSGIYTSWHNKEHEDINYINNELYHLLREFKYEN